VEVIEVEDSTFEDFDDSVLPEERERFSQKMLLVRRELFEIRDLLSSAH
jgi:hypothetical protein